MNPLYGPYADAVQLQERAAKEVAANRPAAAVYLPNQLFRMPGAEKYFTDWTEKYLRDNFNSDAYLTSDSSGRG